MDLESDKRPVVQPCPLKAPVVDGKSQRFHKMQHRPCGGAAPGYIACIRRDLRIHEYDMYRHLNSPSIFIVLFHK